MADLISLAELPEDFTYPPEFIRTVELGLVNIEPWWIMSGDRLRQRHLGLAERYPARTVVPFAIRQDNDDVACWEVPSGAVVVLHDFASPGHEERQRFDAFYSWLRKAFEDFVEFD